VIGNNELHLNTATVMEALQMWLDAKMLASAPTVIDVKSAQGRDVYVVTVSSTAQRPSAPGKS
jgi:hypothetical protein